MLKKCLKYSLILCVFLIIVIIASAYYFLNTTQGLKNGIALVNQYSGYRISAENIDGHLLNHTQLTQVRVKGNDLDFSSDTITLTWQPKALLEGALIVKTIAIDNATLVLQPGDNTSSSNDNTIGLSDISLPFNIELDTLSVNHLIVKMPTSAEATSTNNDLVIDKIQLSMHYVGQKAVIDHLAINAFDTTLTATGNVETQGDFPLTLTSNSTYHHAEFNSENIDIEINGHLKETLKATVQGKGVVDFRLDADITALFSTPRIDSHLHSPILSLPLGKAQPDVTLRDTVVTASGTLSSYQLRVQTVVESQSLGETPLTMDATGSVSSLEQFTAKTLVNEQPMTLTGWASWQPSLRYTATLQAAEITPFKQFPGIQGLNLKLSGDAVTYQANGTASIFAETIPASDIQIEAAGTPTQLDKATLRIDTLGGQIVADASGQLSPLAVTAVVSSDNLQPQIFYRDVTGNISHKLRLTAQQKDQQLTATAIIDSLEGSLQNYPLSGSGTVIYSQANNRLDIDKLAVAVAGNHINADGSLALDKHGNNDLKAVIDAPQLQYLYPGLGGNLTANITAQGTSTNPAVQAQINGQGLRYREQTLNALTATADINLASDKLSLNADMTGFTRDTIAIDKAHLDVDGSFATHRINLDTHVPDTADIPALHLVGQGGLDIDKQRWSGELQTLTLDGKPLGQWQLAQPTPLTISAQQLSTRQLCLRQRDTRLCLDGQLQGENGTADISIQQLNTQYFAQFLPDTIAIDTTLSGTAKVKLSNGTPHVNANLSAQNGTLTILAGSGRLDANIQRVNGTLSLKNNHLKAVLNSELSQLGKIDAAVELADIKNNDIRATVTIDTPSLSFVEQLTPQLSDVSGRLNGKMSLSGNPNQSLQVAGKIRLEQTDFNVPQFGSEIRQLQLDIVAKNGNKIGFVGSAKAGSGKLDLKGELDPTTQRGQLSLQGDNVQIANSNKLQIAVSPDLQILLDKHIQVRGEIFVPKALIVPEMSSSKVTVSEDVVLPNKKRAATQETNSPIDVEVSVKLGDDVRVASADIETRLHGSVNIEAKPNNAPKAAGTIEVETGELRLYGQMLTIERGRVIFSNGPIANPALDIRTTREIETDSTTVTVGANILGNVSKPEISLFSTPSMADSSILSYLLFGRAPDSESFGATALLQTGGIVGANTLARDLRTSLGLDVLDFSLTGVEAGKNLSKKMYASVKSNFFTGLSQFLFDYKISSRTRLESALSSEEISVDLIKIIETD